MKTGLTIIFIMKVNYTFGQILFSFEELMKPYDKDYP